MAQIKAFVSSTFEDLRDHRAHVIRELRRCGIEVDPMEDWTAASDPPKNLSTKRVQGCQLCVLLVAHRRGHVPSQGTLSITQLEYEEALRREVDVLVYLLGEDSSWPPEYNQLASDPAVLQWRERLKEAHCVGFFNEDPNSIDVSPALFRWLAPRVEAPEVSTPAVSSVRVGPIEEAYLPGSTPGAVYQVLTESPEGDSRVLMAAVPLKIRNRAEHPETLRWFYLRIEGGESKIFRSVSPDDWEHTALEGAVRDLLGYTGLPLLPSKGKGVRLDAKDQQAGVLMFRGSLATASAGLALEATLTCRDSSNHKIETHLVLERLAH